MLLKMSILKMSSNTEIREKGECAAVRAVGQGLLCSELMALFVFCAHFQFQLFPSRQPTDNRQ
jgi:hypothetical protein